MKYEIQLDDFLKAPVYTRTWYQPTVNLDTLKFGVMFRLYDVALELLDNPPLLIEEHDEEDCPIGIILWVLWYMSHQHHWTIRL